MKHIEFKKVPYTTPDNQPKELDYKEYIKLAVIVPDHGQQGVELEEMRKAIRVLDALDKCDDTGVDLEDADFAFVCSKVTVTRFNFSHPVFVQFVDSVTKGE